VRSNRSRVEVVKIHWAWPLFMALTVIVGAAFILPYYFLIMMPKGLGDKDAAKNVARGLDDNGWTNMASGWAGFSVEPNKDVYTSNHPSGEFIDIASEKDRQAKWRKKEYLGSVKDDGKHEKLLSFEIAEVLEDGTKAKTKDGRTLSVIETKVEMGGEKGSIIEKKVDLGFSK
jgi:hypothetical protein